MFDQHLLVITDSTLKVIISGGSCLSRLDFILVTRVITDLKGG